MRFGFFWWGDQLNPVYLSNNNKKNNGPSEMFWTENFQNEPIKEWVGRLILNFS